jgi:hypothetical protein
MPRLMVVVVPYEALTIEGADYKSWGVPCQIIVPDSLDSLELQGLDQEAWRETTRNTNMT